MNSGYAVGSTVEWKRRWLVPPVYSPGAKNLAGRRMSECNSIMFTFTTYGMWLRGDERGWVYDKQWHPPSAALEAADRASLNHAPFEFEKGQLHTIGQMIGRSLIERQQQIILALAVRSWHLHFIVGETKFGAPEIAKCAKDAVRWGLRLNRPIWTADYDKRFSYDEKTTRSRIEYVEQHNV
ncbi:MAG: hypothetical protein WEA31_07900, partial [Pirellulales bacterium]